VSDDVILVVEDDPDIVRVVSAVIERAGHRVVVAGDGREGLRAFHERRPDLVVLDVGLPGLDGWEVLERVRELADTPVLMLSAHDLEADKVRGLRGGADDYLTKPFGQHELAARVDTLLRRGRSTAPVADVYLDDRLEVRFDRREVLVQGEAVALTPLEYRLLGALVRHRGQVLSPEQLLDLAWNDPLGVGPDRVKFSVLRLRRKLGWSEVSTSPIEAVRGFGYRYLPPEA
jgi:DNA-binding response OmpR family regulator